MPVIIFTSKFKWIKQQNYLLLVHLKFFLQKDNHTYLWKEVEWGKTKRLKSRVMRNMHLFIVQMSDGAPECACMRHGDMGNKSDSLAFSLSTCSAFTVLSGKVVFWVIKQVSYEATSTVVFVFFLLTHMV